MTAAADTGVAIEKPWWLGWRMGALWLGLAALAVPTLIENARQNWSLEQGEQAPIVLGIGLWLFARRWPQMRAAGKPGSAAFAAMLGGLSAVAYLFGRVSDQYLIESYAFYSLCVVALYALFGISGLAKNWFALAYLVFALPAPYTLTWLVTSHLRLWITQTAVATFGAFGFLIVRNGLNILVDQYEIAVREACSGMNSLISLSAIGLVYVHLRRAPGLWYYVAMAAPIIGFAVFANFVRICILIALTHYFGDAVAQSFLHEAAGLVTFLIALCGVIGVDAALAAVLSRFKRRGSPEHAPA